MWKLLSSEGSRRHVQTFRHAHASAPQACPALLSPPAELGQTPSEHCGYGEVEINGTPDLNQLKTLHWFVMSPRPPFPPSNHHGQATAPTTNLAQPT